MALVLWCSRNGVALDGPITALSGDVILSELGQFSGYSVVVPAASARAIAASKEYTEVELEQTGSGPFGVGTIQKAIVVDARQTLTESGEDTITLDLRPLTEETTWDRTLPEWVAENLLSVVAARLGALVPGWTGTFTGAGTAADITVSVNLNNPTILAGFIAVMTQFAQFVRQGVDSLGVPTRALEGGQFGAAPTITIQDPKGGSAEEMIGNLAARPVVTVERSPNTVTDLVNVVAPYGGGQDIGSLVTLQRLWEIINDPTYVNYGRYGSNAESQARSGKDSVFPEYDPAYPISDPKHPPTGGAVGSRAVTLTGRYVYLMYDAASYALYGHKMGEYMDSSLTYADNSVANQETTARALYVSTKTNFLRRAHPHHVFSCTAPGTGRPTRAGDLIAIDVQKVSIGEDNAAVVEMDINTDRDGNPPKVVRVTRSFNGDNPPVDTYIVSNNGRFEDDETTNSASQAATLISLQRQQGTGLAPLPIYGAGNCDHLHPLIIKIPIPAQLFRWEACSLGFDFYPYRATAATAANHDGTAIVAVGGVNISLPTPTDLNLAGTFQPDGSLKTSSDGFSTDLYVHVYGQSGATGATTGTGVFANSGGANAFGRAGNALDIPVYRSTNANNRGLDTSTTATSHTVPLSKTVKAANTTIAHIPAGQHLADLPAHTHPLDQRIPDGPTFPNVTIDIDGLQLSSGIRATNGMANPFTGSAFIADVNVGGLVEKPGQVLTLTFTPGTGAGSPYGTGYLVVYGTWFGQFGGLTSIVRAS